MSGFAVVAYLAVGAVLVLLFAASESRGTSPKRSTWERMAAHPIKVVVLWLCWPLMVVAKFMEDL